MSEYLSPDKKSTRPGQLDLVSCNSDIRLLKESACLTRKMERGSSPVFGKYRGNAVMQYSES